MSNISPTIKLSHIRELPIAALADEIALLIYLNPNKQLLIEYEKFSCQKISTMLDPADSTLTIEAEKEQEEELEDFTKAVSLALNTNVKLLWHHPSTHYNNGKNNFFRENPNDQTSPASKPKELKL